MKPTPAIIGAATSEHVMVEQTSRPVSAEERWITHNAEFSGADRRPLG